jgi:hypothetical protein
MKERIRMFLPILVILAVLTSLFGMAIPVTAGVSAASYPPGATSPSIGMSLSVRDASTHLPVNRVRVGDVLEFVVTMSVGHLTPPEIAVNYEQGTLALKIGAGSYQHVAGYNDTPITMIPEVSESIPFVVTVPFTYTVNMTDIGAGGANPGYIKIFADYGQTASNPAGVNGWYLFDPPTQDASATLAREIRVDLPDIDLVKYVWDGAAWQDADTAATGPYILQSSQDPVTFKFVITNTGNVALTNVTLSDVPSMAKFYNDQACTSEATFPIASLASLASVTVYGQLPWAAGQQTDTATTTGTPPVGANVTDSNPANYFGATPGIDIVKWVWNGTAWEDADTPTGPFILQSAQDPVTFKFVITNTGSVALTNVTLSDAPAMAKFYNDQACTSEATFPIASLAAGDSVTVYGQLPWAADQQTDTATTTGTPPVGPDVTDNNPANYFGSNPSIDIEKYVSVDGGTTWLDADSATGPSAAVGSDVKFYVEVKNTGDVELTNIVVGDTDFTFTGVATTLAAGASDTSDVVTVAAVAGQQYDLADVKGTPPVGPDVTDEDPAYYSTSPEDGGTAVPVNKWVGVVLAGFLGVLLFLKLRKRREA